ncbi:MAG: hypothetical protein FJ211_04240 [Ignavibacteria bacterium]|nr:hypothetical protein [Ignavibacteria bacterium]
MARIHFSVSYSIADGKRGEYLQAIANVRAFYENSDINFSLFEVKGKHNHFQEIYVYPSPESYEASDDPETTAPISASLEKIYSLANSVRYEVSNEIA